MVLGGALFFSTLHNGLLDWCKSELGWRSTVAKDHESGGPRFEGSHVDLLISMAEDEVDPPLGPQPDDLVDVLCDLALGRPWRVRIAGASSYRRPSSIRLIRSFCQPPPRMASGFRSLFNMPETIAMLRGAGEDTYWRLTLQYGIDGNLQAAARRVHSCSSNESLGLQEHSLSRSSRWNR
jgi:hypothetical protein